MWLVFFQDSAVAFQGEFIIAEVYVMLTCVVMVHGSERITYLTFEIQLPNGKNNY